MNIIVEANHGPGATVHSRHFHVTTPAPRDVWRELAQVSPHAMTDHKPGWIDAICAGGHYADASRLYELPGGKRLLLPLVRQAHLPARLSTAASPPSAWGFGGLISGSALQAEDIAFVLSDLVRLPYLRLSIRPNPLESALWEQAAVRLPVLKLPRTAHVLDLSGGFDVVWKQRFNHTARKSVRKAEKSGLVVECDTTGRLLPVYYDLYRQSLERWAEQQHEPLWLARWRGTRRDPLDKLQHMARHLPDDFRLWVAWLDGKPIVAMITLQAHNAHVTRTVMNRALAGPVRANVLLEKLAIEEACQAGSRVYHMGESGTSASLAQFKEQFGAQPYAYAEYRLERLPVTRVDTAVRGLGKRLLGFKDA